MSNAIRECMLTTNDNPFNPFDDFDKWYLYDLEKGYNTCALIGRMSLLLDVDDSDDSDLSYAETNELNELIIDRIINSNINTNYVKVYQDNDYYAISLPNYKEEV